MLSPVSNRPPKIVRIALALFGALALVATSCGGGPAETAAETAVEVSSPAEAEVEAASPTPTAEPAPAEASLVATTVSGGQIDFGSLEGQDVVLWFWAPW